MTNENLVIAKKSDIVEIAEAVRSQTGSTEPLSLDDIANEVKTLSSTGGTIVQANWNQNDETAPDYVKNRTHWVEQTFVELLPEFEVGGDYIDLYDVSLFSKLNQNAKCIVTIDGITYETTAVHYNYNAYEWYIIGNSDLLGESGDHDLHLPFGLFVDRYDENWGQCEEDISTIKIDCIGESVVKIPEIYLPTKIGTEGTGSYSEIFNNLNDNIASGDYSRAENFKTTASGYAANAQGLGTVASGYATHAQGCNSEAKGSYSHAEGYYTLASGAQAHAEGEGTIAKGENQHVSGSYNIEDTSSLVIVGNGSASSSKSNAYKLDKNGNGYFSGEVYAQEKKLATEEYINIRVPAWTAADEGKVLKIINGTPTWSL
jgi:hypothetical protein